MNKELKRLSSLAKNNNLKLLPVMENLTKDKVSVKVTDKNRKHIAKTLKMFGERVYSASTINDNRNPYITFIKGKCGKWCNTSVIPYKTPISHKQLRTILAKEHLKEGDYVVLNDYVGVLKVDSIYEDTFDCCHEKGCFSTTFKSFKRYTTPEEIALLEPKPKELEVGKWYLFIGHTVEYKPLMLITKNNGSDVKFCGFNFIGNWVDNDLYTLEDLKRHGYREATPQEVESALIEEAKMLGHKYEKYVYNSEENTLCGYNGRLEEVFVDGKWNEPYDKFAELKEAHKNGAVIQFRNENTNYEWADCWSNIPSWEIDNEYRIKPEDNPKVGDVCKFWDVDEDIFVIGKLKSIDTESQYKFVIADITNAPYYFINAKTLTQQEAIDLLFNDKS